MSNKHRFAAEKLDGLAERDLYRKQLAKRLSNRSVDSITGASNESDLLLMGPMYKALNNPEISGSVETDQVDKMFETMRGAKDSGISPVEMTPDAKTEMLKLKMYMEQLKRDKDTMQNLA
jgi:hypothetical protein